MFVKQNTIEDMHNEIPQHLSKKLEANMETFSQMFDRCDDLKLRTGLFADTQVEFAIYYFENMIDKNVLQEHIIKKLQAPNQRLSGAALDAQYIYKRCTSGIDAEITDGVSQCLEAVLRGKAVLLIGGVSRAIVFDITKFEKRAIAPAENERVVRGPNEAFTELLSTNLSMIRRRIISPDLKLEFFSKGRYSKTQIALLYIDKIVRPNLVEEVRSRLERIDTDVILESGYIQEYITDNNWTVFPTIQMTERPDKISASLLQGRVVIMVDNTPISIVVPTTLQHYLISPEDYYHQWYSATFFRQIRYIAFGVTILTPAFYIAITTFHQEMIPGNLLQRLVTSNAGVPFSSLVQILMLGFAFEILRESGLRMPLAIGQAVSIVGALVMGEAAVTAGLVSPAIVVVTAITAITSFIFPYNELTASVTLMRASLVLLAGGWGLYGLIMGIIVWVVHLNSLRSFGVPYLYPWAPFSTEALQDGLIRAPMWSKKRRPILFVDQNRVKLKPRVTRKGRSKDE